MDEPISIAERYPARWWHLLDDGRIQCDLCPRDCRLRDGQRGACFVRGRVGDAMVLTTYGRSSGFCVDPIEKKPLNHFLPGTKILSLGTVGCNFKCDFCQNWQISQASKGVGKKIIGFPATPMIWALRFLEILRLSPLYKWVYETAHKDSFVSIEKAERILGFRPKYSNKQALVRNYEWYLANLEKFKNQTGVSHRVPWKQGILKIAKYFFDYAI